jgi:CRP-like cAMP-binding protein
MQESIAFNLIILLIGIISAIMVIRPIVLWYWSISSIKKLLEEHSAQNRYIIELLQTQQKQALEMLSLMRKQVEQSPKPPDPLAALRPTD